MTYPATTYAEGVELTITSGNQLHEIINGDATEETNTESGMVPSLRKALADSMLFKPAIAWAEGSVESDPFQTRLYGEGIYWAPAASNETPISMGNNPTTDSNWFLAPVTGGESISRNTNLLSNHNFIIQSPDDITHPSVTPTDYVAGTQIFSGVFVGDDIVGLTYIDGRVSWTSGTLYFSVPNSGALEYVDQTDFVASVADFDGKPRTRGVSYALVGDEYRVTVGVDALEDAGANPTLLGSVKLEQGGVATGHDITEASPNIYRGLWPDTGGSANKGDTYQTQVSGTPTGQYFTALQSTTVDPVGDNVNWRSIVSDQSLGDLTNYQADSVADMIAGNPLFSGSGSSFNTMGYYSKGDGGNASYIIKTSSEAASDGDVIDDFGVITLNNGNVAVLQIDGEINLFKYGVNKSQTKERNSAAFSAALLRSDFDVCRIPFVAGRVNFTGGISITNGKKIIFDSQYMGESLLADPDAGFFGDGTKPFFTTGTYPATANTNRQIRIDNARIRNTNYPCLELLHSDDAILNFCNMITRNSEALKGRFSARVLINGGHYLTGFDTKEMETNFAITMYDNCNGLEITPTTVISGGSNGGGVDVTQTQKVGIDGIYEVCGGYGQRVGGFSGNPNALWQPSTFYARGTEVKNTNNGWVSIADHTSGSTFDSANWKVINGNCNGVSFGGYMEQVQRPFSMGSNNYCLGVTQSETYVGNSALPANGVPVPDFCIELGLVVGLSESGVSYHKEGTEPTFRFYQSGSGGVFGDFLQDSTIENHHVQGGGADFENALISSDNIGQIFGRNRIRLTRGSASSGDVRTYTSDLITASAGTGNNAYVTDTVNGGTIDSIEIIEKSGDATCTLRVGSVTDTAENLLVDPESLTYTNGAAVTTLISSLIRPSTQTIVRVVAGSGSGSFRVRITYRV